MSASWRLLRASRKLLEVSWRVLKASWRPCWAPKTAQDAPRCSQDAFWEAKPRQNGAKLAPDIFQRFGIIFKLFWRYFGVIVVTQSGAVRWFQIGRASAASERAQRAMRAERRDGFAIHLDSYMLVPERARFVCFRRFKMITRRRAKHVRWSFC